MRKVSFAAYAAWNYEKEEQAVNKKSEQGWQLIKGGCFHSVFEKDETARYRYRIDCNPKILKDREEKERYIDFFACQGWEYVNSTFNGWNYFKKAYREGADEKEYEIYTDSTSYLEMLGRWVKIARIMQWMLLAAGIVYLLLTMGNPEAVKVLLCIEYAVLILILQYGISKMKTKVLKSDEDSIQK